MGNTQVSQDRQMVLSLLQTNLSNTCMRLVLGLCSHHHIGHKQMVKLNSKSLSAEVIELSHAQDVFWREELLQFLIVYQAMPETITKKILLNLYDEKEQSFRY